MNHFYYEIRAKEKMRGLIQEGQRSQTFHRSGAPRLGLFAPLLRLIVGLRTRSTAQVHTPVNEAHVKAVRSEYGD